MPKSTYGRFKDGVQISGVSLNVHQKGQVLYVCNSSVVSKYGISGANDSDGLTPEHPLSTITAALALCTANRGDKIVVLPGHAETVTAAAGIAISVAGVDIVGVGTGSQRPTITFTTANTATVTITANDISISNILFVGNFLAIATALDITTAKDLVIDGCEFRDTDATHGFVKAIRTNTTDNAADRLKVTNSIMNSTGTTAATSFINARGAVDGLVVVNNFVAIQGTTATTGALVLATAKALTCTRIEDNAVNSALTTSAAGALIVAGTGGSGYVRNNYINVPAASTAILDTAGSGLGHDNNKVSRSAADTSGLLLPAVSS